MFTYSSVIAYCWLVCKHFVEAKVAQLANSYALNTNFKLNYIDCLSDSLVD